MLCFRNNTETNGARPWQLARVLSRLLRAWARPALAHEWETVHWWSERENRRPRYHPSPLCCWPCLETKSLPRVHSGVASGPVAALILWLSYPVRWPGHSSLGSLSTVTCWSAVAWAKSRDQDTDCCHESGHGLWLATICQNWPLIGSLMYSLAHERRYLGPQERHNNQVYLNAWKNLKSAAFLLGH